jgi:hypothetical protein
LPAARKALAKAAKAFDADDLDEALFEANVLAELAGELMVRDGERGGPAVLELAREQAFVSLPWREAVEAFRERGTVTDRDLETLLRDVATRSARARADLLAHIQDVVHDKLAAAIENDGSTFREFAEAVRDETIPLGINPDDDAYLQMVFRTNVQGAYSAGRDRASKDPDLLDERPIALYLTAGDGLVRSEHAQFAERNGGMYEISSPEWGRVRPPPAGSPFNCRCSWVTLTLEQARERGWKG